MVEFFTAQKCAPIIDQVWYETDDRYLIDGAPVLLMKGMLFCKRGGIITIEVTEPENNDGEGAEKTQEQVQADMKQANAEVEASVDQALAEGKIDAETAQFMKDGYSEALQFANGDIDMANQLFADLTTAAGIHTTAQRRSLTNLSCTYSITILPSPSKLWLYEAE